MTSQIANQLGNQMWQQIERHASTCVGNHVLVFLWDEIRNHEVNHVWVNIEAQLRTTQREG